MRNVIENEKLVVTIDDHGAEVRSVVSKLTGKEYMWCGDSAYWGRVSPVLFPIVGGVRDKKYTYQGKTYNMGQHGLARDLDFVVEKASVDEIMYLLKSDEKTKESYPFDFELRIRYTLDGNTLGIMWIVNNPADENMFFSIGAHPAFACGSRENGPVGTTLVFGRKRNTEDFELHYRGLNKAGNALHEDIVLPTKVGYVPVTDGFFDRSALMFENKQADFVSLLDVDGKELVRVSTDRVPLFAVWSPEGKKAPLICIEPWYGRCDAEDYEGDFSEREYIEKLEGGETFEGGYEISFL